MKFHNQNRRASAYEHYREAHPVITYVGADLTPFQMKIAERFINATTERFFIYAASRQSGKSFLALQLLLYTALNNKDTVSMFVSMTYSQTEKLFNELVRATRDSGVISSFSKASHEVQFINGSQVLFRSYQNPDSCRGYHISGILIIDEAAWMNDGDFDMIFLPMLQNHRKSKALIISSPRGCNWFYNYYMRGTKGARATNKSVLSFRSTYEENPFCDKDEIMELSKTLPPNIFKQEFMAEFISNAMSAFGDCFKKCMEVYDFNTLKPSPTDRYYAGIDVGRQEDYTVLTIMSSLTGRVVDIVRIRQTSFENIVSELVKHIKKWNPVSILCETNGIGDVFFELLQKKLSELNIFSLKSFTTTNMSKNNIVEALKIAFENGEIIIPDDIDLIDELEVFECNYSKTAHAVVYSARSGKHDDMVMSLCICNWARRNHINKGNYAIA